MDTHVKLYINTYSHLLIVVMDITYITMKSFALKKIEF